MADWRRRVEKPSWLRPQDPWPRAGHRKGMPVRGYGRTPCRVALVGEGPGFDEAVYGYPFVGASGSEVDRHLARILHPRAEVYVTNLTWHLPDEEGALGQANPHLLTELEKADPDIIMTLGAHATRYFLGDDMVMEAVHGIPYRVSCPWRDMAIEDGFSTLILPAYHPAAGMHQVELSAHVAHDFDQLRRLLDGELVPREGDPDEYRELAYQDWTDDPRLLAALRDGLRHHRPVFRAEACGIDTEGSESDPISLQFSFQPGRGVAIRGEGSAALATFGDVLRTAAASNPDFRVYLHNAMHDLPILRRLGIDLLGWGIPFYDTMVLAYHLCVEPQGLKALAYRWAGMRMGSYQDQVGPYTYNKALAYLLDVAGATDLPKRPQHVEYEIKDRRMTPKLRTPTPIHKRAAKIITDVGVGKLNKDGEPPDPYARWYQIDPEDRAAAEARFGVLQAATLRDVPPDLALTYMCRDADATRRIGPLLLARHQEVFGS